MIRRRLLGGLVLAWLCAVPAGTLLAGNEQGSKLPQMVVDLLGNRDKDFRAAGLDQVRSGAQGAAATKLFAEQLPNLDTAAQVALLSALADRGDAAARPAVLKVLNSTHDENVRAAAIATLGKLGSPADLPLLVSGLSAKSKAEQAAARAALVKIRGAEVSSTLAAELGTARPEVKAGLIEVLATRRAKDSLPAMIAATLDDHAQVRRAAMTALGQIGTPLQLVAMLGGVLKAEKGSERDDAEKAIVLVCTRIENENQRADAVVKALDGVNKDLRDELLPLVGRIGGKKLINFVGDIATSNDAARRKLAIAALGKWPDASAADKLREIVKHTQDSAERDLAFQGYVKISATRDKRSDKQRLDRMREAMKMAKTPAEQSLVINRCRTAYDIEALRFVLPYLDQPQLAQMACETIVELAHHREIRDPNKAEFDKALDRVIQISKNPVLVDRANRYKRGETWSRQ